MKRSGQEENILQALSRADTCARDEHVYPIGLYSGIALLRLGRADEAASAFDKAKRGARNSEHRAMADELKRMCSTSLGSIRFYPASGGSQTQIGSQGGNSTGQPQPWRISGRSSGPPLPSGLIQRALGSSFRRYAESALDAMIQSANRQFERQPGQATRIWLPIGRYRMASGQSFEVVAAGVSVAVQPYQLRGGHFGVGESKGALGLLPIYFTVRPHGVDDLVVAPLGQLGLSVIADVPLRGRLMLQLSGGMAPWALLRPSAPSLVPNCDGGPGAISSGVELKEATTAWLRVGCSRAIGGYGYLGLGWNYGGQAFQLTPGIGIETLIQTGLGASTGVAQGLIQGLMWVQMQPAFSIEGTLSPPGSLDNLQLVLRLSAGLGLGQLANAPPELVTGGWQYGWSAMGGLGVRYDFQ